MKAKNLVVGTIIGIVFGMILAATAPTIRMVGACGAPGADPCPTYLVVPIWGK